MGASLSTHGEHKDKLRRRPVSVFGKKCHGGAIRDEKEGGMTEQQHVSARQHTVPVYIKRSSEQASFILTYQRVHRRSRQSGSTASAVWRKSHRKSQEWPTRPRKGGIDPSCGPLSQSMRPKKRRERSR